MASSPFTVIEALEASQFTIAQVADALLVRPMMIMNYQLKNSLDLCSASPGRGSPRRFCLLDVYMLALLREIIPLTGNASLGARDVNRLVFSDDPLAEAPLAPSRRAGRKRLLREDIGLAHELFFYRHVLDFGFGHHSGDWFLLAADIEDGFRPFRYIERGAQYREQEFGDLLRLGAIARPSGAFINATMALTQLDRRLFPTRNSPKHRFTDGG